MREAVDIARSVRALRPFGTNFVGSRKRGDRAAAGESRCFFTLLAYQTSLVERNWLAREWRRYEAALGSGDPVNLIDMIVVLDRGLIAPPFSTGKADPVDKRVLHMWFVSLANFISRENKRRAPMDWQVYLSRYRQGWTGL
jgi:hypothetical protein